jgi:predicted acetyltransferase
LNEIRPLSAEETKDMARILRNAYPGYDISEDAQQKTEDFVRKQAGMGPDDQMIGHFEADNHLSGGIRLLIQPINMRMQQRTAAGLGALCVDLLHKKEKIALRLIQWTFNEARRKGACMAVLDPFNIGFYRKIGCGIGSVYHQFRLKPAMFPNHGDKRLVIELADHEIPEIIHYHQNYFRNHHGMLQRSKPEIKEMLKGSQVIFGARNMDKLTGVMGCRFERTAPKNLFKTNMIIEEMVYDHPEVLHAFLSVIHTQADQVSEVIMNSQDRYFETVFNDPNNGYDDAFHTRKNEMYRTGCGMMYRILDVPQVLSTIEVTPEDETLFPVRLNLEDTLLRDQAGEWHLTVLNGRILANRQKVHSEIDLHMEAGDLSSLIMGALDLNSLAEYGRVDLRGDLMKRINRIFCYHKAPVCLSRF